MKCLKNKNRRRVCYHGWFTWNLICATLCIRWLSVQYNNKKTTFWVFIQLISWARCDLYYIFTVIDSYRQKKKTTTREWEGMGVILPGVERDFPPVFSWDWDGKRLKFVMHFGNRRWAPGLMRHLAWETRSQRLTFSHYLGSTHILNAFGRIQMSHFNLD